VQCRHCGLVYSNPRPIPATLGQHYDKAPEDYWAPWYFEENDGYFGEEIEQFKSLFPAAGVPVALDVGAGLGKAMQALSRAGMDAYGLEPSKTFYERTLETGIDPGHLQLASAETAEYPSEKFDFVTFGAVLEHLHDPAIAIERALNWLTPNGLIHGEVPHARWLVARGLNALYRLQGTDFVTNLSPMHPPYHLYEFTLQSFAEHGRRVGYEIAHSTVSVGLQPLLPRAISRLATRAMGATDTGMQLQVWLRRTRD
jgi:SAM-dependent methyltransferase